MANRDQQTCDMQYTFMSRVHLLAFLSHSMGQVQAEEASVTLPHLQPNGSILEVFPLEVGHKASNQLLLLILQMLLFLLLALLDIHLLIFFILIKPDLPPAICMQGSHTT